MDDFTPLATDDFEPLAPPPQDVFDLPQKAAITQWASDVGSKVAPERNADVIRLSAVTGLPPQSVHDNFDLVKEQIDRKKIDYASLAKTHPILSEFLSQPERAGVAKDDEGVLGTIEGLFRGWRDIPKGAGQQWDVGAITQEKGRIGARMMDGRATKADLDRLKAIEADEASNKPLKFGYLSGFIPQSAQAASQFFGPFRDPEATVRIWGTAGAGALAGAAAGAPAAGVGAGPGAAAGFFAGLGAGYQSEATYANAIAEAGNAYLEYMKIPGVTHEDAVAAGRLVGLVNGAIEFVALDKVVGLVPGARALLSGTVKGTLREALKDTTRRAAVGRLMKAIVAKGLVEGAQEAAQEFTTIFEGIRVRPDQPNSMEALKESFGEDNRARMWESFTGGTQMSLIGLPSSMIQFHSDFRKAQQSEVNAALFTALGDAAKESKTRSRLPSVFRSFVDSVQEETGGPVESVKVPASNLNTLFQTEGITSAEVEREMPEVARQMREAVEAGTPELEVAVPIADMATKIAPLSGYAGLHEDMRIGDGLTIRESKKVMAEAEKIYTEQKDPAREATPAEKVADDIGAKLESTGLHPKVARQQAVLWAAFAEARASRTGAKDAWDYYSKARVEVARDEKAGAGENVLEQPGYHGTPHRGIDKFSLEKIGTGEGAQAYGWGLYFAEQKDVAEQYRNELSPISFRHPQEGNEAIAAIVEYFRDAFGRMPVRAKRSIKGIRDVTMNTLRRDIKQWEQDIKSVAFTPDIREWWEAKVKAGKAILADPDSLQIEAGQTYKVDVPEKSELLDWDKPLSAQPPNVQAAIKKLDERFGVKQSPDLLGRQFYSNVMIAFGRSGEQDKAASEWLRDNGVRGLMYLDGTSRSKKDGTHNFVIWDEAAIKILETLHQTPGSGTGVRGFVSFDNARTYFSVTLTGKANLSTFLHESGHAFVEMLRRDAAAGHAESQTDLAALEEFAGVQGGAWTVEAQEKLARAFEKYLAEGEAPSNKLEAAFRSFKDWMATVYRTLVGLNVELDERTRQVFGRLLATDQEINERARTTGLTMPDFGEVKGGIFTEAEHSRLKSMWDDGIAAMKESLLASSISALRRDVDAERARVEAEVSAELNADKTQNAWAWLMTGRRLDDAEVELEHDKIQAQAVKDAPLTDQERRRLRKVTTEEFATSADEMAPYFGFGSGSEMVVALARRESLQKARRRMVDERMAAMYPEGTQDHISKGATEEVQKALSGRLGRVLEAELDAVGAKVGGEKGRVILAAIRQAARRQVASMTLTELDPARYARAAKTAGQDYLDALAKGDGAIAAFQAKRAQAWALEMWRAATEAKDKAEAIRKYLDTFSKDSKRSKIFKAGANYLAAIDALLEGIEFKRRTGTTLHKRAGLAAYLAEMEAAGETVNIPVEARTEALLKNYRQMSLDELLGVEAAVSNLETLARLKNKLSGIQANRKLSATSADLADSIHDSWAEKGEGKIHPGLADEMKRFLRKGRADLLKIEFLTRALDGGKTAGLAHTLIFQPFARAEAEKMRLVEQILGEFKKPFDDMPVAERMRLHRKVDFLGEQLSFSEVLAVALNWGNEGNREKLLEGYKGKGWTEQKVMDRLDELLEARDWQLVTHIWKTIDSLWPMITDLARRSVGAEVDKVEGVTIHTRHGPVAGGYYPVVYDRKQRGPRVGKGMALRDPEELAQMKSGQLFENNFMAPGGLVDRGFTKSRTKYAAPILLSLSVVPAHVTEVIHYLTHFEAVRDVDKLLRQDVVKTAVEDAVGVEGYQAFRPWLQAIANNGKAATAALYYETFLRKARLGTSIVMLGGKLTTGLIQGLGLLPAMKELKTKHILSGFKTFLTEGFSEAREQSPSFRYQEEHFDRDLGDVYDRMASTFGEVSHLRNQITTMSMAWIKLVQGSVNAITWYAAREQAEQAGHADPVAYADATVRLTQSSGGIKDLAAVQRGGETQKLFTVMYSYFSTLFGQLTEPVPDSKTAREKTAIYAARWWWAVMLPVVVEAFARGKRPDGDEPEDWATFILKEQLLYTGRTIPFIGDIADAALSGRQPRGNPWLTTMTKGVKALGGAAGEGEMTESQKRAVIDLIGAATRLPTGGAVNAYRYLDAFTNGEMEEPVQNLLFRSPGAFK